MSSNEAAPSLPTRSVLVDVLRLAAPLTTGALLMALAAGPAETADAPADAPRFALLADGPDDGTVHADDWNSTGS
ncbi:hypothetical protein ABZX56_11925 [Streptomyces parvulus]|uniref:Uncharacterized protein n=1 Tax=Streptomyces parvulus TaxID=146923 RepID=A0A191UTJ9_9ACTN|nr:hypothetical protein [Streptomyces parvulus]ANJ06039.1 hypothetical protein Spa2297_02990 [Streptomyces parvulus]GGR62373.1 hypothetical protein GCM10010220_11620 [Streptomyces parvulus]